MHIQMLLDFLRLRKQKKRKQKRVLNLYRNKKKGKFYLEMKAHQKTSRISLLFSYQQAPTSKMSKEK
jgi:hypothetical protein